MHPLYQPSRIVTAAVIATAAVLIPCAGWAQSPVKQGGGGQVHVTLPGKPVTDGKSKNVTAEQQRAKTPDKPVGALPNSPKNVTAEQQRAKTPDKPVGQVPNSSKNVTSSQYRAQFPDKPVGAAPKKF